MSRPDPDPYETPSTVVPFRKPRAWASAEDPRRARALEVAGVARALATSAQEAALGSIGMDRRRVALAGAAEELAAIALRLERAFEGP